MTSIWNLKLVIFCKNKTLSQLKTKFDKVLDNWMPPGAFFVGL